MSIIKIDNLTFSYPGAEKPIFENLNLNLDTDWRLGLIGRNGRGKTTFLNLLMGNLKGNGNIYSVEKFEYFPNFPSKQDINTLDLVKNLIAPFSEWEKKMEYLVEDLNEESLMQYGEIQNLYELAGGYTIEEQIIAEADKLEVRADIFNRPYSTLSGGEKVKLLLVGMFLKKNSFLLIDEPTDHLDMEGRAAVSKWLTGKKGFILVSHDRAFIDNSVNHILSINKSSIDLQKGNYSSWHNNTVMKNIYEDKENQKLNESIKRLQEAAKKTENWSDKVEASKNNNSHADKGYIGAQSARMMKRSKSILKRKSKEIETKQQLLNDVEENEALKFLCIQEKRKTLVNCENLSLEFNNQSIFKALSFNINQGERVAIKGKNGCGKTSLLKIITGDIKNYRGQLNVAQDIKCSYVCQDTSFLKGSLREFAVNENIDESLFLAILRKLNFNREMFAKNIENFSAGQKKKVVIAASLAKPSNIFIWDEAFNYIDVLSREQIENAILLSKPTMVFVEHDEMFEKNIATKIIRL